MFSGTIASSDFHFRVFLCEGGELMLEMVCMHKTQGRLYSLHLHSERTGRSIAETHRDPTKDDVIIWRLSCATIDSVNHS